MNSLAEFIQIFNSDKACENHLTNERFKSGKHCLKCGHNTIYKINHKRKLQTYKCQKCNKKFTIITGTIFEGTKAGLQKWYLAQYLLTTSKKGVSSIQMAKQIGVTQKTAWFMLHRLRELSKQEGGKFQGTVEVDETFVGGKEKNKHASKKKSCLEPKNVVIGVVNRETKQIKAQHIPNTKAKTLHRFIHDNVTIMSNVMTDDNMAYRNLKWGYKHSKVVHSRGEYANEITHTNNIESFWAVFKRGYYGIYHYMSKKHLQRYVNEFVYRYNEKGFGTPETMVMNSIGKHLPYKKLIADFT